MIEEEKESREQPERKGLGLDELRQGTVKAVRITEGKGKKEGNRERLYRRNLRNPGVDLDSIRDIIDLIIKFLSGPDPPPLLSDLVQK